MKDSTIELIRTVLKGDETVTKEQTDSIMKVCKRPGFHPTLINAKQAMELLGISRPTLRAYVKGGHLKQINLSARKVRFDEADVQALAIYGV